MNSLQFKPGYQYPTNQQPPFNQGGASSNNFGFQHEQQQTQWQFNGFQQGFPPPYNYSNFNEHPGGAQQQQAQNWPNQHQWNNWNYYNNGQPQPSGENSSYQRTLEYVQQCQQQSWSANNPQ